MPMNSENAEVEDIDRAGPIRRFLTDDHRRFDALLDQAGDCSSAEELAAYHEFRRGLLKHIGIEEKILLMAAQRLRGEPLEQAARLRSDHGALVALLMPAPTPAIIRALRAVIAAHNPIEEGPGGVYDICEQLAQGEAGDLLKRIREAPEVPTNPNLTNPRILEATRRALARAGYDPALLDE
jgi:hypothetical protein